MEKYVYVLGAGETLRVPEGNQLFVYSITGADEVELRFWSPDGSPIAPFSGVPVGFRFGPGVTRADGASHWQWAEIRNSSGDSVTAVLYVAKTVVDLSAISPRVTISAGSVDADTFSGAVGYARGVSRTGENAAAWDGSLNFTVSATETSLAAGGFMGRIYLFCSKGGDHSSLALPHQIVVERLAMITRSGPGELLISNNLAQVGISGVAVPGVAVPHDGIGGDLWNSSSGMAAYLRIGGSAIGVEVPVLATGSAGGYAELDLSRNPIIVEGTNSTDAGADVDELGCRHFVVKNTHSAAQDVTLIMTCRVVPLP